MKPQVLQQTVKIRRCPTARGLFFVLFAALPVACKQPATELSALSESAADRPAENSSCGKDGFLQTTLSGGIATTVEWSDSEMLCENMLRPQGAGARLRFSGEVADNRLAVIVALPDLRAGKTARELPSNVTITVEGSGRFFSTPGLDSCWTDISEQERLSGDRERYTIAGTLFCIAPLGELNGDAAVTIIELSFHSIVDWSTKPPSLPSR